MDAGSSAAETALFLRVMSPFALQTGCIGDFRFNLAGGMQQIIDSQFWGDPVNYISMNAD